MLKLLDRKIEIQVFNVRIQKEKKNLENNNIDKRVWSFYIVYICNDV